MVLVIASAALGACSAASSPSPTPLPESELVPGLALRGGDFADFDDHLVEIVVHEDYAYVANSNRGIAAMRLDEEGGVSTTDRGFEYDAHIRCTSVAVHAPSDTLYCAADAPVFSESGYNIEIYDLSEPGAPVWRERVALDHIAVRDLEVIEGRLVINHFDEGITSAAISGSGELSAQIEAGVSGNARFSVPAGGRIVTLFADPEGSGAELRLYDAGEPGAWVELDRLALAGPALGLRADARGSSRVGVGLGSGGMAIVASAGDKLVVEHMLQPPAVVSAPILAGDLAYAVTLSGVFGYALDEVSDKGARMFGFGPSAKLGHERAGNMLHGVMYGDEVLTSDWLWVERWAASPAGEVLDLDVPRGIYLPPQGPVRWRMRNPGRQDLRVELWWDRSSFWVGEIAGHSELSVELSAAQREQILSQAEPRAPLSVRVYDPAIPSEGTPVSSSTLVIAEREEGDPTPPALGDIFPTLTLVNLEREVYTLPTPAGSQTIWFWPDCAMMWPQLEDLAWLEREDVDLGRGTPVMLTNFDVDKDNFIANWALSGATVGMWGNAAPEIGDANDHIDDYDIYEPLWIELIPGDAMPTDYVVDAQGVVHSIERMYRGPWTLVEPWPWGE